MKQLLLFPDNQAGSSEQMPVLSIWKLYIDGASRNNPGPAGAGVYIVRDDLVARTAAVFLGKKTNNEAEYFALLLGLFELTTMVQQNDLVIIVSDSQLLVRQISGIYKVKEPRLQSLHALAKQPSGIVWKSDSFANMARYVLDTGTVTRKKREAEFRSVGPL